MLNRLGGLNRMTRLVVPLTLCFAIAGTTQSIAQTADDSAAAESTDATEAEFDTSLDTSLQYEEKSWRLDITPYAWLANVDGTVGVGGAEAEADASFTDILENIDFVFMGRMELTVDRFHLFLDGTYLKMSDGMDLNEPLRSAFDARDFIAGLDLDPPAPPDPGVFPPRIERILELLARVKRAQYVARLVRAIQKVRPLPTIDEVNVEMKMAIVEFGGGFEIGEWEVGETSTLAIDALAGVRYFDVESTIDVEMTPGGLGLLPRSASFHLDEDWFDPIVGARITLAIGEHWMVGVRGDVGGFGVGSDLAWNLVVGAQYRFNHRFALSFGYRILDIDYDDGSGSDRFVLDAQMRGPFIGFTFSF